MKGYWNSPAETSKVLGRDGFLATGDIGVMDEKGYVRIVDRKKDMLLVSGFNVYPNEIEAVVAMLPGVLECAVIGVPDEHSGEVPKLFVVKRDASLTDRKSTRLNSSHSQISYAVFCLKKKKNKPLTDILLPNDVRTPT